MAQAAMALALPRRVAVPPGPPVRWRSRVALAAVAFRARDCGGCGRPRRVCLCDVLPEPMETRTRLVIFRHPQEERRALGTADLLEMCLKGTLKVVGKEFPTPREDPELHQQLGNCFLLYPGAAAREVGEVAEELASLILIDARWEQARVMLNRSEWLQELPRVALAPRHSGYVWRRQPAAGCVSSLEAAAEALGVLEGPQGPGLRAKLLRPFRRMVELQRSFIPKASDKNVGPKAPLGPANAHRLWARSRKRRKRWEGSQIETGRGETPDV